MSVSSLAVGSASDFVDRGLAFFLDVAHKSKALPRGRTDQALLLAAVADSLAHRIDSAVHRRLRNDSAAPHGRNEVIFADHAAAVFNQIHQKIENLWLNGYRRAIRAQLSALAVERKIIKQKQHVAPRIAAAKSYRLGRLKRNQDFLKDKSSVAQSI